MHSDSSSPVGPGFRGSPNTSASSGRLRWAVRSSLYLGLAAVVIVALLGMFKLQQDRAVATASENRLVASQGVIAPMRKRLSPEYTDKQGRLLADAPTSAADLLDPPSLVLAHNVDTEADAPPVDWDGLRAILAQATDREVVLQEYEGSVHDVSAVKAGKIHIVALHSADTPNLVNNAGYIPCAVLGTEAGAQGNRLDIAVSTKSKIKSLAELRGHVLTCTRPDSITGYRAAVAVLMREAGLRPASDYSVSWSFGQSESIHQLAAGKIEVAALSDDKVQSQLKRGRVAESDFRTIYQSKVIPHLTIGTVHQLQPALAGKITLAITDFENQKGAPDEISGKPMRFLPIDYKQDFEFVRNIDDAFDPRFGQRLRAKTESAPAEAASK